MSRFDSFVAIDLETTGLDPSTCKIIEIGAVRYENGVIAEKISRLVNPGHSLPAEITRLTGITDQMLESAPGLEVAFGDFRLLIEKTDWIIGHNVSFDLGFLKPHFPQKKFAALEPRILDTGVLARILYPRLPRYGLSSIADYFKINRGHSHRALDDCLTTAAVYLRLISHLASLETPIGESVGRLLLGTDSIEKFRASLKGVKPGLSTLSVDAISGEDIAGEPASIRYPDNVSGSAPAESYDDYIAVDPAAVENCFLPGGILSKTLESYEYRAQQSAMAVKAAGNFNRSEFLLAEAPTGIGKSLAYLLPAAWWAALNRERVIISTQTKSLQAQLFYKDLPQIHNALGIQFKAALLKGKSNYICLYKYKEIMAEAETAFDKRDREALAMLALWVRETRTGDISECHGFSPPQNYYLWSRISCEGSFCLNQACPDSDRCFLLKIRREAQSAQIIVTNHHLTFADFASGGELALGAGNIIFDEAHNLEKVAASYLGNVVDKRNIDAIISDMYASRPTQSGFLPGFKLSLASRTSDDELIGHVDSLIDSILGLSYAVSHFFEIVTVRIGPASGNDSREISYNNSNSPCKISECREFLSRLDEVLERLDRLIESLREVDRLPTRRETIMRLDAFASDLKSLKATATDVLFAGDDSNVYWAEKPISSRHSPRFLSAPLEVGKLLDKKFYDHLKTAIFTSATLTVEKRFDYIVHRLGLDLNSQNRVETICLNSPFDINSEVAVISAGFLPSPKQGEFEAAAIDALREVLISGARKSMVLFTSHRSLRNSVENLKGHLEDNGIELYSQENAYSSERIFRRFKSSKKAVLFGTDTFWEGIDLPGELLELLILFKLPFTVPDRPWFKANLEKIEISGESSFANFSLPDAVVKFRQGFGRLIRTANDRGCVVILDSRVEKYSFGRVFLNSVDGTKFKSRSTLEIVNIIRDWLKVDKGKK